MTTLKTMIMLKLMTMKMLANDGIMNTENPSSAKSVLCNTILPTTPSYDHKCYYSVNFLEGETEAPKGETIYSRHEAGEVVETCAANREKHGPEQQRKRPWQTIVL